MILTLTGAIASPFPMEDLKVMLSICAAWLPAPQSSLPHMYSDQILQPLLGITVACTRHNLLTLPKAVRI